MFSVLTQKYNWRSKKARDFADFLEPMLEYDRRRRATAWECLNHEWIKQECEHRTSGMSNSSTSNDSKNCDSFNENLNGKIDEIGRVMKEDAIEDEEDSESSELIKDVHMDSRSSSERFKNAPQERNSQKLKKKPIAH